MFEDNVELIVVVALNRAGFVLLTSDSKKETAAGASANTAGTTHAGVAVAVGAAGLRSNVTRETRLRRETFFFAEAMPRWFEVEPNVFGDVPLGEVVGGVVVLLLSPRTRRARSTLLVCAIAAIFRMWLLDRIGRRRGVDHKLC